jgi:hypothetical protein
VQIGQLAALRVVGIDVGADCRSPAGSALLSRLSLSCSVTGNDSMCFWIWGLAPS